MIVHRAVVLAGQRLGTPVKPQPGAFVRLWCVLTPCGVRGPRASAMAPACPAAQVRARAVTAAAAAANRHSKVSRAHDVRGTGSPRGKALEVDCWSIAEEWSLLCLRRHVEGGAESSLQTDVKVEKSHAHHVQPTAHTWRGSDEGELATRWLSEHYPVDTVAWEALSAVMAAPCANQPPYPQLSALLLTGLDSPVVHWSSLLRLLDESEQTHLRALVDFLGAYRQWVTAPAHAVAVETSLMSALVTVMSESDQGSRRPELLKEATRAQREGAAQTLLLGLGHAYRRALQSQTRLRGKQHRHTAPETTAEALAKCFVAVTATLTSAVDAGRKQRSHRASALRWAAFQHVHRYLVAELQSLLAVSASEPQGPPADTRRVASRSTAHSQAHKTPREHRTPPNDLVSQLQETQDHVDQCVRVLQAPESPHRSSSPHAKTEKECIVALTQHAAALLDLQHWLTAADGLLPSVGAAPLEARVMAAFASVCAAVGHHADLFPALCQPALVQRVERLRQRASDGHRGSSVGAERTLYATASREFLVAARLFHEQFPTRATCFATDTLRLCPPVCGVLMASQSLAEASDAVTAADASARLPELLHGVSLLCACVMQMGMSPTTVVGSGLCVSMSAVEAADVASVYGVFRPRDGNGLTTARLPARLHGAVMQGALQMLETCGAAVRRMVVTPTQLLQVRHDSHISAVVRRPEHLRVQVGEPTGLRDAFEDIVRSPPRLAEAARRGCVHLAHHGPGSKEKEGETQRFTASAAMTFDAVRQQVEVTLYAGIRALVLMVSSGDKDSAVSILPRLASLLNFYGADDALLHYAELITMLRCGVSHTLASLGRSRPDGVLRWEWWHDKASSTEWPASRLTPPTTTTADTETALQAVVLFIVPQLVDAAARAQRQSAPPALQARHVHRPPARSVTSSGGGGADWTDRRVVEHHLAAVLRLTADVAILGSPPSAVRQLATLHHALITAHRLVWPPHQSSTPPRAAACLRRWVEALLGMLVYTSRRDLPAQRHASTLSGQAANAMLQVVLTTHLEFVRSQLLAPFAGAISQLPMKDDRVAVLLAIVHLLATADIHFPLSAESHAMHQLRVEWLGPALAQPVNDLCTHTAYVTDSLAPVVPHLSTIESDGPGAAVLTLAMVCEVASVTCTSATVHAIPRTLYDNIWRTTEACVAHWRRGTAASRKHRPERPVAASRARQPQHQQPRPVSTRLRVDAQENLEQKRATLFRRLLAHITATLAVVFDLSTDDGVLLQHRFAAGLARVMEGMDLAGVSQLVRCLFQDEVPPTSTARLSTPLSSVVGTLDAALKQFATTAGPPHRLASADALAIMDALTRCPSPSHVHVSGRPTATGRDELLFGLLRGLVAEGTPTTKASSAVIPDGQLDVTQVHAMDIMSRCALLRISTRQLARCGRRADAAVDPNPTRVALQALCTALSQAVLRSVLAQLVPPRTRDAPVPEVPLTMAELCAVVDSAAALPDGLKASRDEVLRAAVGPLLLVIPALPPEVLVRIMESYARSDVSHEALWMHLTLRVSQVGARVSLPLAVRLVRVAIGTPPFHHTTASTRAACRGVAYPIFERQVRHVLQNDPYFLTNASQASENILQCLVTCFAEAPVSEAVLEALVRHPERLSIAVMKSALSLAATRPRDGSTPQAITILTQRCTDHLIPQCGPGDLAELGHGLVACGVRTSALVVALRARLAELFPGGVTDSSGKPDTGADNAPAQQRALPAGARASTPPPPPSWQITGATLAALADVVVALGGGAEDAQLVNAFTAEMRRVALAASHRPRDSAQSEALTASQICALLGLCRAFGTRRMPEVMPSVDALLEALAAQWPRDGAPPSARAFLEGITAKDMAVALNVCLTMASTPKAHRAVTDHIAVELHNRLSGTPEAPLTNTAAWRSDLALVVQPLTSFAQLCGSQAAEMPVVKRLCDVLYAQRRQLHRRPHLVQSAQQAMRLLGRDAHPELFDLVVNAR